MTVDMKFAWIPPGRFLMGGAIPTGDNPQHRVTISKGFWMGVFPVTQMQWEAVMGYNPSNFRGQDRPVETVSWSDCQEFCQLLGHLTSKPIRLPTEAEWEFACRAGTTGEYWYGNGQDALKVAGWYGGNSNSQTKPVGQLAANPWGLHDVHGNVWEWCFDWHGGIAAVDQTDPVGPSGGSLRVARGGSSAESHDWNVAAARNYTNPSYRDKFWGLRVCFHQS